MTKLQAAISLRATMSFLESSRPGNEEVFEAHKQVAFHNITINHKRCICTEEKMESKQ